MSHLRWYWIVVCSASLLVTGCGGKKTAEVIKAESQKSVALISHLKGHGVGVFVEGAAGVCTLLTAKHVVPDGKEISILTMTSKLPFKPLDIRRADNADLAVVTFKPLDGNCPFPALKLGDSNDVVLEQKIYISIYPGGINGQALKRSFIINSITDKIPGEADGYEIGYKPDTLGGTSGSPVLNEFGEVIAVHGRSYLDKDSKLLVNKRANLDLGIPINLYKQNQIAKVITVETNTKLNDDPSQQANLNHNFSEAHNNRGISKPDSSKKEKVISNEDRSVKLNSNNYTADKNRGVVSSNSGKKEETTASNNRTEKLNRNNFTTDTTQVITNSNLDSKKKSISNDDRLKKLNLKNSAAYYLKQGIAKSKLGKKEEAIADYDQAIELNPNSFKAYFWRGHTKASLRGERGFPTKEAKEEAIADYDRAIEINPNSFEAYVSRGNIKGNPSGYGGMYTGSHREAIADYDLAIKLNPNSYEAYFNRGTTKSELGENEEAIADYNRVIKINPKFAVAYRNRGVAKFNLGKTKEARVDHQKAARLYLQQGNMEGYQHMVNHMK